MANSNDVKPANRRNQGNDRRKAPRKSNGNRRNSQNRADNSRLVIQIDLRKLLVPALLFLGYLLISTPLRDPQIVLRVPACESESLKTNHHKNKASQQSRNQRRADQQKKIKIAKRVSVTFDRAPASEPEVAEDLNGDAEGDYDVGSDFSVNLKKAASKSSEN